MEFLPVAKQGNKLDWTHLSHRGVPMVSTYATTLLRDGVDLVSLQKLLGHNDMDSTRKYLRALEPADLEELVIPQIVGV
jgi:site-specific recombinase XerC